MKRQTVGRPIDAQQRWLIDQLWPVEMVQCRTGASNLYTFAVVHCSQVTFLTVKPKNPISHTVTLKKFKLSSL